MNASEYFKSPKTLILPTNSCLSIEDISIYSYYFMTEFLYSSEKRLLLSYIFYLNVTMRFEDTDFLKTLFYIYLIRNPFYLKCISFSYNENKRKTGLTIKSQNLNHTKTTQ